MGEPSTPTLTAYIPCKQVTTTVLKNGDRVQSDMVVVGVGAKPTGEMFKGQIDFLEERPGGIKVRVYCYGT